ncbi:ECF-type sigma factor [Pseudomarimonas arenosa]|uniref:RNA polymerase subunit sigma n=1 Tax=Pseudomarimonas arenosa TaxID=2774145 RepID=A0AAW3ZSZ7_9GAMM|nr:ECF-type sigma factor [Pseudomarimonas arenosa]MBD8528114.1 RNA polymerase subunit sigma [Pseudomarimonas arenosa]
MSEITEWLCDSKRGDRAALPQVFAALYQELHRVAQQRWGGVEYTLSPTVLVNEAYLRLSQGARGDIQDRQHFMACAQRVMHAVWVDHLRLRNAQKRGGNLSRVELTDACDAAGTPDVAEDLAALDQALDSLQRISPRLRQVAELRLLGGFELAEIATTLNTPLRSTERDWQRARALLMARLERL